MHIHVSDVTRPQKKDIRTRFSFNRKDPHHQWYADELWNKSGGIVGYLGEWHTHPEQLPKPSSIDTGDWLRITKAQKTSCIFIIGASAGPAHFHLSCVFEGVIKECEGSR
jgi:integrative and conjugative element protein (TIGR02256 family)